LKDQTSPFKDGGEVMDAFVDLSVVSLLQSGTRADGRSCAGRVLVVVQVPVEVAAQRGQQLMVVCERDGRAAHALMEGHAPM
jgi:hypothetical protein